MHAGCGEVVKEKKSAASFDITAIFLLVMQVVVGATQRHWTQGFVLFGAKWWGIYGANHTVRSTENYDT